jgi:glycosyltransferase involved in cell wall biosynthesis
VPFLATPVGAIPDYLRDSVNGFLLTELSPEAVAARLADLLADPGRLRRMAEAGRATAAQLTWSAAAQALDHLALRPLYAARARGKLTGLSQAWRQ